MNRIFVKRIIALAMVWAMLIPTLAYGEAIESGIPHNQAAEVQENISAIDPVGEVVEPPVAETGTIELGKPSHEDGNTGVTNCNPSPLNNAIQECVEEASEEESEDLEACDTSGITVHKLTIAKSKEYKKTLYVGETLTLKAKKGSIKTCKSSKKSVAKATKKGVITALKAGKATITVTTSEGIKATVIITVKANRIDTLNSKPKSKDIKQLAGAWTLWPKSVEMRSDGKITCQFYLLNATGKTASKITNLYLTLAIGNSDHVIAQYRFKKITVSCRNNNSATITATFPKSAVEDIDVFLPDCSSDDIIFDMISTSDCKLKAGNKEYDYEPTKFGKKDIPELNWSDIEASANEYDSQGRFWTLNAVAVKFWLPSDFQPIELSEKDKDDGLIAAFTDSRNSLLLGIGYSDLCGSSLEDFAAEIQKSGAQDLDYCYINGLYVLGFSLPDSNFATICFVTESGYLLSFMMNPYDFEKLPWVYLLASIQADESD